MIPREKLLNHLDKRTLWRKYCGFLELSAEEFMAIQGQLLLEQIEMVSNSTLAKKILGDSKPSSLEEFRDQVPLTIYKDYLPYLEEKREDVLFEKPFCWVHTAGMKGDFKWVPYTSRGYQRIIDSMVSALILASAKKMGDVNIKKNTRIMFHLPTRPYLEGHFAIGLNQRIACQTYPPIETIDRISSGERMEKELELTTRDGVDFLFSMPGNLVEVGSKFTEQLNSDEFGIPSKLSRRNLKYTLIKLLSRIKDKPILPHHLYRPRGVISIGADSHFYKQDIDYYWGKNPYDIYMATEAGCLAFSDWTGEAMTFTPFSGFLEFIPEEEWQNGTKANTTSPRTVLINELEIGRRYELVVTNFYGMPFLRYRLGDIIKVVAPKNSEGSSALPQLLFDSRLSDIIDVGSSMEINEKKMWQALLNSGLKYEDWFLVKEETEKKDTLHLYVELRNGLGTELDKLVSNSSVPIQVNANKLMNAPDVPMKMTILPSGTFKKYKEDKEAAGYDPAYFKPVHINPDKDLIQQIISPNGTN